jgi:hypothetical protein
MFLLCRPWGVIDYMPVSPLGLLWVEIVAVSRGLYPENTVDVLDKVIEHFFVFG